VGQLLVRSRRTAAALVAIGLAGAFAAAGPAAARACPPSSKALSPRGPAAERFTMLIRVNQLANARTYASRDQAAGGLADRIRTQDVFVVNTRFGGSDPREWSRIVRVLRSAFPCNRIAALNGLGGDPSAPGYAYALLGHPGVWATLTDWELLDWRAARASNPYLADWSGRFPKVSKRVRRWVGLITSPGGPGRAGLVPELRRKWHYGELARSVSAPHRRIAGGRRGLQVVQTQASCADGGARGMKAAVGGLLRQYKRANFKRVRAKRSKRRLVRHRARKWKVHAANLGVEVSFTEAAQPWSSLPLLRTSPIQASACTGAALKRGAGAILYWASPDSMRALLSLPRMCALRPGPGC
jgi:hypothetical protein